MVHRRKALVIEDDPIYARFLAETLSRHQFDIEFCSPNQTAILQRFDNGPDPDLLVMDIFLEEDTNGLVIADQIQRPRLPIIFTTAFPSETLLDQALALRPAAVLIKPFDPITLVAAAKLAIAEEQVPPVIPLGKMSNSHDGTFFIRTRENLIQRLDIEDVSYLEADGNYCEIHSGNRRFIVRQSLASVHKVFEQAGFLRIHRNFAVRLKDIETVDLAKNELTLKTGKVLPISRTRYKDDLLASIRLLR